MAPPAFTHNTTHVYWKLIVHLLNSGFAGFHPSVDDDGQAWQHNTFEARMAGSPICDGKYFLVLWGLPSDLEYYGNELKMPHFNSNYPCWPWVLVELLCFVLFRHAEINQADWNLEVDDMCRTIASFVSSEALEESTPPKIETAGAFFVALLQDPENQMWGDCVFGLLV